MTVLTCPAARRTVIQVTISGSADDDPSHGAGLRRLDRARRPGAADQVLVTRLTGTDSVTARAGGQPEPDSVRVPSAVARKSGHRDAVTSPRVGPPGH